MGKNEFNNGEFHLETIGYYHDVISRCTFHNSKKILSRRDRSKCLNDAGKVFKKFSILAKTFKKNNPDEFAKMQRMITEIFINAPLNGYLSYDIEMVGRISRLDDFQTMLSHIDTNFKSMMPVQQAYADIDVLNCKLI